MRRKKRVGEPLHIGVFVDSASNYGRGLLNGIADFLEEGGQWSVFVESHATGTFDASWVRRWRGDGILAFIDDRRAVAPLSLLRLPIVETYGSLAEPRFPQVRGDDEAIGRLAAGHLLDRRIRHFAFTGYPGQAWSDRRRQGFVRALASAGHPCACRESPRSFTSLRSWEEAQDDLTSWLRGLSKPLGVMACSDRHAQRVLDACRRATLRVPDEVAVIGTDNDAAICRLSQPPLSSVEDNPRRIGFEAARLLEQIIRGRVDPARVQPILVPPLGVVARASTETTVTEDAVVAESLRFIREHACDGINAHSVYSRSGISRSAFYRRFRAAMGRTAHEEILRVRLARVQELLTHTRLPLARISRLTGFEHPEYMGAVFKSWAGETPGEYRARHFGH